MKKKTCSRNLCMVTNFPTMKIKKFGSYILRNREVGNQFLIPNNVFIIYLYNFVLV